MASFNRAILMGNLCRDPELRYTSGGKAVAELSLAVNSNGKNNQETLFINVTVWERQAETCCEYLTKGSPVLVEGRLKMDSWEDKESGKTRHKILLVATNVTFLRTEEAGAPGAAPAKQEETATATQPAATEKQTTVTGDNSMDDSEIPF